MNAQFYNLSSIEPWTSLLMQSAALIRSSTKVGVKCHPVSDQGSSAAWRY